MQKVDLTNQTFSSLTVLHEIEPLNGKKRYLCQCVCGNTIEKSYANLKGHKGKQSCGCMSKQWQSEAKITHGERYTKLYKVWQGMKTRSVNSGTFFDRPEHDEYKRKNITICEEWLSYENFSKWAKNNGYIQDIGLSIDRIDNEKGYYPENCRWTTSSVQGQNTKVLSKSNTTGYRGVSITTRKKNPYRCLIYVNNKQISLGNYATALEAAKVYDTYVITNKLEHSLNGVLKEEK